MILRRGARDHIGHSTWTRLNSLCLFDTDQWIVTPSLLVLPLLLLLVLLLLHIHLLLLDAPFNRFDHDPNANVVRSPTNELTTGTVP